MYYFRRDTRQKGSGQSAGTSITTHAHQAIQNSLFGKVDTCQKLANQFSS